MATNNGLFEIICEGTNQGQYMQMELACKYMAMTIEEFKNRIYKPIPPNNKMRFLQCTTLN